MKRLFKLALMRMPERYAYAIFETLCFRYGVLGENRAIRDHHAYAIFEALCARYRLTGGIRDLPGGQGIEGSFRDFGLFVPLMQTGTYSGAADGLFESDFRSSLRGTYIDIGANIGVTTIPYALKYDWDFYAFEPDPDHFRRLQCNLVRNGVADRVRAYNVALYDKAGTLDLRKSPVNFGDYRLAIGESPEAKDWETVKVQTDTLDNLLSAPTLRKPIIVKLDTQGAEPFILRGGKSVIAAADIVLTELDPHMIIEMGNDPMEFFDSLHAAFPSAIAGQRNGAEIRKWISEVVAGLSRPLLN